MRTKVIVISNNPSVNLIGTDQHLEGGLLDVLKRVRDLVHKGHQLISHPLAGSVKPNETPYKSVVISKRTSGSVDFQSLAIIEGCLRTAERMLAEKPLPNYPEKVLSDFQLIDAGLLETALSSLPGNL